jgi:hypothetical protein
MRRSEDFLVYNDLHFTKKIENFMKLHFKKIRMRSYTSRKLLFTLFNEKLHEDSLHEKK